MSIPTNAQRAERAYRTLLAYQSYGGIFSGDDVETLAVDFLADLMHEVRMNQDDDFDEILERARVRHDAEAIGMGA